MKLMLTMTQARNIKASMFAVAFFFATSVFAQVSWDNIIEVASAADGALRPQVTTNAAGDPLVIWGKSGLLMYSRWDGNAFTPAMRLNPSGTTIATADWMGPAITSHGDTAYIVYKQTPEDSPNSHIWILRSFDGGITWSSPLRVEFIAGDGKSRFPTVTTNADGHPVVAYMKFNPAFGEARWVVTRSEDYGATWLPDVKASGWSGPESEVCDCCPGTITSNGNTIVVLYRDNNEHIRDSWAAVSYDGGETFTDGKNVDQQQWEIHACPSTGPDGVIIGDSLYCIFMNAASGAGVVYYNAASMSADSIPPALAVDGFVTGRQQNFPRIANHGLAASIVWREYQGGNGHLALLFSEDIRKGWPAATDTVTTEFVSNTDIALSEDQVFVVWQSENSNSVKMRMGRYKAISGSEDVADVQRMIAYPNPVIEKLFLSGAFRNIAVYDPSGQVVAHASGDVIEVRHLSPGIYFVSAGNQWQRFIKI